MIKMGVKKIGEPIIIPEPNNGHSKKTAMMQKKVIKPLKTNDSRVDRRARS